MHGRVTKHVTGHVIEKVQSVALYGLYIFVWPVYPKPCCTCAAVHVDTTSATVAPPKACFRLLHNLYCVPELVGGSRT